MADKTTDRVAHKGLLVPDPRFTIGNIWDAQTTRAYTNEGPTPSTPQPGQNTDLVLEASGDIPAGISYEVQTKKAGFPGANRAGFVWRGTTDTDWRGHNPPNVPMAYENIVDPDGLTTLWTRHPQSVTLSEGTVLVAYEKRVVSAGNKDRVVVSLYNQTTAVWTSATVWNNPGTYSTGRGAHPCMCVLPDDRILLFHWVETSSGDMQVRSWVSDDKGATWSMVAESCLDQVVTYAATATGASDEDFSTIGRLRCGYKDGQVLLVAHCTIAKENIGTASELASREVLIQWASSDLGGTMSLRSNSNASYLWTVDPTDEDQIHSTGGFHDIVVADGYFNLFFISLYLSDGAGGKGAVLAKPAVRVQRLANAYLPLTSGEPPYVVTSTLGQIQAAETQTVGAGYTYEFTQGDLAACLADTGEIYVFHRYVDTGLGTGEGVVMWSGQQNNPGDYEYLGESSWTPGTNEGVWWATNTAACYPRDFCVTWAGGHAFMPHNWDNASGSAVYLSVLHLGGYTTVTLPPITDTFADLEMRVGPEVVWLPYDLPDNLGWTLSGAGTVTLNAADLNINAFAGTANYTRTLTATPAEGAIVWGALTVVSATSNPHVIKLRLGDGSVDYGVQIEFDDTGTTFKDVVAGSTIATDTTVDPNDGIEFLFAQQGDSADLWVRARTTASETDREWVAVGSTSSLTNRGTPSTTKELAWGAFISSAGQVADWVMVAYSESTYSNAGHLTDAWTNPDDLMPRSYSPDPVYVDQGLLLAAKDGPSFPGETQQVDPRYTYGVNSVFPRTQASPRRPWWYTNGDELAVRWNDDTGNPPPWLSDVMGFAVVSAPGTEVLVHGYNGSTWDTLGTLSTVENVGATTRSGDTFHASSTGALYFHSNELLGAWFYLSGGGEWCLAPVLSNSEGRWDNTEALQARIVCDWNTKTNSGSDPASGTGYVFHPSSTLVIHQNGTDYSAFRFTPTHFAPTVPDAIAKLGTLVAGPVFVFGQEYAWGRVVETEANLEITEAGDWTRWTRSRSNPRRLLDFAWTDGIDSSQVHLASAQPDYIKGTTDGASLGVASVAGTAWTMEGLTRFLNGAETPVVYLPSIEVESTRSGTSTYQHRDEQIYGRITSPVRIESVQGEENSTEVVRVASLTLEEEL